MVNRGGHNLIQIMSDHVGSCRSTSGRSRKPTLLIQIPLYMTGIRYLFMDILTMSCRNWTSRHSYTTVSGSIFDFIQDAIFKTQFGQDLNFKSSDPYEYKSLANSGRTRLVRVRVSTSSDANSATFHSNPFKFLNAISLLYRTVR